MKTPYEVFKKERKKRLKEWDRILAEDYDRYSDTELEEIDCREAYFHFGEIFDFPRRNKEQWTGMCSKVYREGPTGEMVMRLADDVYQWYDKGANTHNPKYSVVTPPFVTPNFTNVKGISNYKLMRRCVKMLRNTPGGLRYDIKPPPGTQLPNIKLHPRVESAIRSLLVETIKKQEIRAKMDKVGYMNYKLNYKPKEKALEGMRYFNKESGKNVR